MIKLLEEAIASVQRLPERDQELAPSFSLAFANPDARLYQFGDQQVAEVNWRSVRCAKVKIATDTEMDEVWQRFGR